MRKVVNFSKKFGVESKLEPYLATSLGTSCVSLLELTRAYNVFPNQGRNVNTHFAKLIEDASGTPLYAWPQICLECRGGVSHHNSEPPKIEHPFEQATDDITAYQMTSMLEGVVQRGTGWRAKALGRPAAAKTGTTNDFKDALFVGFTAELAVGVWVGYDTPQSLGNNETGSKAASPIWVEFLDEVLEDKPIRTFEIPEGINFVRIDENTGLLPGRSTEKTILEAFRTGTEPKEKTRFGNSDGFGWGGAIDVWDWQNTVGAEGGTTTITEDGYTIYQAPTENIQINQNQAPTEEQQPTNVQKPPKRTPQPRENVDIFGIY